MAWPLAFHTWPFSFIVNVNVKTDGPEAVGVVVALCLCVTAVARQRLYSSCSFLRFPGSPRLPAVPRAAGRGCAVSEQWLSSAYALVMQLLRLAEAPRGSPRLPAAPRGSPWLPADAQWLSSGWAVAGEWLGSGWALAGHWLGSIELLE